MDNECPSYTLKDVVEQYLIRKYNSRLKHFAAFFSIAGDVYKDLFRNILPSVISKYVEVIQPEDLNVDPYPYILKPKGMDRFISVSVTNCYGKLVQLIYNANLNVFTKPVKKKTCGCVTTDLCDCIDNLTVVITPKEIDGTTYYVKVWVQCCANGDVMQYSEVPVAKYGTIGGSYSNDYGDDYDIISETDNIVVLKFTKNLGKVTTKDCGCVEDTPDNQAVIYETCCNFLPIKPDCCKEWFKRYRRNAVCGEIKFSECGTKIYLKNVIPDKGDYVVLSYQPMVGYCGQEILVPEYSRKALWSGIEEESNIYNDRVSDSSKQFKRNNHRSERINLFEYLNPMHADRAFEVNSEIKF